MPDVAVAKLQRVPMLATGGADPVARRQPHSAAQRHVREWKCFRAAVCVERLPDDGRVRTRRRQASSTLQHHHPVRPRD